MKKPFVKTLGAAVLATSLALGTGTAVLAAPKTAESLTTGRTELQRMTGVIAPNPVPTLAHYATDVTLTGSVVIDGPQLVLLVNGRDVSRQAVLTKVADKTWTYSYPTTVGTQTGDVTFLVDAYTVYANGKPAADIHTRAAGSAGQTVHVPYVKSYDYTNLTWTSYDPAKNMFGFSYNLVKVWDDGERETAAEPTAAQTEGTGVYENAGFAIQPPVAVRAYETSGARFTNYNRADNTYLLSFELTKYLSRGEPETGTVQVTVDAARPYGYAATDSRAFSTGQSFAFMPPVSLRDFRLGEARPVWTYQAPAYSVSFEVVKIWSDGSTSTETFTRDGLTPGIANTVPVTIGGITQDILLPAPAAPEQTPAVPAAVQGTVDVNSIVTEWTGNLANGGNVKAAYTLHYTLNGIPFAQSIKNTTFTKTGTGFLDLELTYTAVYNGHEVPVHYVLPFVMPDSTERNTAN